MEEDNESLRRTVAELEATCKRLEQDKRVKDHQNRSLQVADFFLRHSF